MLPGMRSQPPGQAGTRPGTRRGPRSRLPCPASTRSSSPPTTPTAGWRRYGRSGSGRSGLTPIPGGVAVAAHRPGTAHDDPGRTDVFTIRVGKAEARPLLTDEVDVTAHCRALVPRPVEADSYTARMLAEHPVPVVSGAHEPSSRLVGVGRTPGSSGRSRWPGAWGPGAPPLPPLRRDGTEPAVPEYADIHLIEDLETGATPPGQDAVDGFLDL